MQFYVFNELQCSMLYLSINFQYSGVLFCMYYNFEVMILNVRNFRLMGRSIKDFAGLRFRN